MEEHLYKKAQQRVKKKKNFFKDVTGFLSFSIFLFAINIWFSPGFLWCLFPIGFYALSILITYIDLVRDRIVDDWEEKELEKEYKKLLEKRENSIIPDSDKLDLEAIKPKVPKWNDRDLV